MNEQRAHVPTTPNYYAGLLRLWHDGASDTWHASFQRSGSSERIGFTGLDQLMAYLHQITQLPEAADHGAKEAEPLCDT